MLKKILTIFFIIQLIQGLFAIKEFGQCGGRYYYGPKKCNYGLKCFVQNKWYSQCLQYCPDEKGWHCNKKNDKNQIKYKNNYVK